MLNYFFKGKVFACVSDDSGLIDVSGMFKALGIIAKAFLRSPHLEDRRLPITNQEHLNYMLWKWMGVPDGKWKNMVEKAHGIIAAATTGVELTAPVKSMSLEYTETDVAPQLSLGSSCPAVGATSVEVQIPKVSTATTHREFNKEGDATTNTKDLAQSVVSDVVARNSVSSKNN